jgi:hypothetical protein
MKEPLNPSGSRGDLRRQENPVGFEGDCCSGFSFKNRWEKDSVVLMEANAGGLT